MEPFLVSKALDMSLPAIGKSVSVVIKGLVVLLLIAGITWSVYVTFIKPHTNPTPTTSQNANRIVNYNYTIKPTFGCMRLQAVPDGYTKQVSKVQSTNDNKVRGSK